MKILLIAAVLAAIAAASALPLHAQDASGRKGHSKNASQQSGTSQQPKANEKAYKAALDNIPDGGKYDPWHGVRGQSSSK
jgi:hypothetical protein